MSTIEFNELLIGHTERLKPYAITLTHDGEEAKDLLSETIYRALANRDKYNEGTNIQAWLFTIMRNTFINNYRRRGREKKIFASNVQGTQHAYYEPATQSLAESRLGNKEILSAIHSLPDSWRTPFSLYFEGYQYQEIADRMNIALGTIKSRIHFARKFLKERVSR
ncbi:RNA polymerase sigma factor [Flavitalea flava]